MTGKSISSPDILSVLLGRERGWVHCTLKNGEYPRSVEEYAAEFPERSSTFDVEMRTSEFTGSPAVMIAMKQEVRHEH
jgi:hypothetical protein